MQHADSVLCSRGDLRRFRTLSAPTCSVDKCDGEVHAKGFCYSHYRRNLRHGDPNGGRRAYSEITYRDKLGRKQCMCCKKWLPEDCYQPAVSYSSIDGLYSRCKRCLTDGKRGLTLERRIQLLEAQGGACLCGKVFDIHGGRSVTYFVDHDHSCCEGARSCGECIRGLLCGGCNVALGHVGDDPEVLAKLIEYLISASTS